MKHRNIFWGIFFVAAAIFVIASQTGAFASFGFWSILATILLAAVFVDSLIDLNFFGVFISAVFLYMIFQKPFSFYYIPFWQLLLAAVFVSIGLSMIFRKSHRWKKQNHRGCAKERNISVEKIDGDEIFVKSKLNETCRYLHADNLKKAHLASSLGKLSVFFDQVHLSPEGAEFIVDISFGEMVLYLPKSWRVTNNVDAGVGSINDNRPNITLDESAPALTLSGSVSFGHLEINYV